MSIGFYIALAFLLGVFVFGISVIIKFSRKRKLSLEKKEFYTRHFHKISKKDSSKEKIIDYDKLYHKILQGLDYKWTFWEILKQCPNEIGDINKIWELHKLRNKLVHDFDILSELELRKKEKQYEKQVKDILL